MTGEHHPHPMSMIAVPTRLACPIFAATLVLAATSALAQNPGPCRRGVGFPQFLAQLEQDAVKAGVSQRAISEAAPYLVFDQGIVNRDRGQRVFGQLFT